MIVQYSISYLAGGGLWAWQAADVLSIHESIYDII